MANPMSKRAAIYGNMKYLVLPINSFSDEQITALQQAPSSLPLQFQCLSPILEKLLYAYEEQNKKVPPHLRAPKVIKKENPIQRRFTK